MLTYILMAFGADGSVRCSQTTTPYVPDDFPKPGEVAFLIQPMDIKARHSHEIQDDGKMRQ